MCPTILKNDVGLTTCDHLRVAQTAVASLLLGKCKFQSVKRGRSKPKEQQQKKTPQTNKNKTKTGSWDCGGSEKSRPCAQAQGEISSNRHPARRDKTWSAEMVSVNVRTIPDCSLRLSLSPGAVPSPVASSQEGQAKEVEVGGTQSPFVPCASFMELERQLIGV